MKATPSAPPVVPKIPDTISLDLCAIFRLLPSSVVHHGFMPDAQARVVLPLAWIEPQMIIGHVEIPLADFANALPAKIAAALNLEADEKVWIPLDEILQNLPSQHPFHSGEMHALIMDPATPASLEPKAEVADRITTRAEELVSPLAAAQPAEESANAEPIEKSFAQKSLHAELNETPGVFATAEIAGEHTFFSKEFPVSFRRDSFPEKLRALQQAAQDFATALDWKNELTFPCADFWLSVFAGDRKFFLACHRAPLDAAAAEKLRTAAHRG